MADCHNVAPARLLSKKRSSRIYCVVYGCLNSSFENPHLSFFKVPDDAERRLGWLRLIGREDLINKSAISSPVCEVHFRTQDVLPGTKRKTLKRNSWPALRLPDLHKRNEEIVPGVTIKQEEIDIPMETSPEIISLFAQKEIAPTSTLLETIKQEKIYEDVTEYKIEYFYKLCDTYLTKEMDQLVKTQIFLTNKYADKTCHGYKQLCLYLYLINPQAFRMFKNALCLPNPNTNIIPTTTDVNSRFMLILKSKVVRMTEMEKNCSVIIDTISLNSDLFYNMRDDNINGFQDINGVRYPGRAKLGFVMTVRGISDSWKLPVGYAVLSDCNKYTDIYKWIDELLDKLFSIGLNVRTFVSIAWAGLFNPAQNKSVTIEKPYFFIGNRKIYYIFDPPHLLKLLRNHFMEKDFHFQECVAKFKHILEFYGKERTKILKIAGKLTSSHVHPNNFEKTRVIYAAQLFSKSVATGLSTYEHYKVMEESAKHTVQFIKLMNDLFDSLNSSDLKGVGHKSAFRGEVSQIEFFKQILLFFKQLTMVHSKSGRDVTSDSKVIEGFQITITSILQLFNDLKSEGFTYLLTRRLNMDVLENFNDEVKKICGTTTEPSTHQFVSAFRKCFFSNIINLPNRGNRIDDIGEILNELQLALNNKVYENEHLHHIKIASSDYNDLSLSDKFALFDVCVFLLKKCYEIHNCENFKSYIKPNQRLDESLNVDGRYQHYRKYKRHHSKSLLIVPYDDFVRYVEKIDQTFVQCLANHHLNYGITALIVNNIDKVDLSTPCVCFPKDYVIHLFTRIRMYLTMTFNNKKSLRPHKHLSVKCINN